MTIPTGKGWRVTATHLAPRYFLTRLDAHRYAVARRHLTPIIWWRACYPNGATGPWVQLEDQETTT